MATKKRSSSDDDILREAKKAFERAHDAESHNREPAEEDIRFARLLEQWPAKIKADREKDGRPCLTLSGLTAMIRQVVNDCRQNKPQIKIGPQDSGADVETADIYSGLIRNIESTSNADLAYDTGVDCAVTSSFGYWRITLDYAHDDTFDQDLKVERVLNPFSIYGDPDSMSADGHDWNVAFVVDRLSKAEFEKKYHDSDTVDWDVLGYTGINDELWYNDKGVQIAEYWVREEIEKDICLLSDGSVVSKEQLEFATDGLPYGDYLATEGITIEKERAAKSWKVMRYILTGAEVLETREWPGRFIPIVPIYGEEIYSEGKRYLRSLTRDTQDACRNLNYWRSAATEMVALAPKVPFTGPEGMFSGTDQHKWNTANTRSWPWMHYKPVPGAPGVMPTRQPLDMGQAVGAISEAANAMDDIKRITGMYDASLGARSNETSGKAIMARQREGDVSTFHFTDNQGRAIRRTGEILVDLIPHVYNKKRIVRVLGEDGKEEMVPMKQPVPVTDKQGVPQMQMGANGQPLVDPTTMQPIPITRIYDLAVGKYDVTVKAGPSYTTRREEAAEQMTAMVQAVPDLAPVLVPEIAKSSDWHGAEKLAEKLEAMAPKPQEGLPPEIQQQMAEAQQAFAQLQEENKKLQGELEQVKADKTIEAQTIQSKTQADQAQQKIEQAKLMLQEFEAKTERMKVQAEVELKQDELRLDLMELLKPEPPTVVKAPAKSNGSKTPNMPGFSP